jgi:hypothetical protein
MAPDTKSTIFLAVAAAAKSKTQLLQAVKQV